MKRLLPLLFLIGCAHRPALKGLNPGESQSQIVLHGVKVKPVEGKAPDQTLYEMGKDAAQQELQLEILSLRFENIQLRNMLEDCQGEMQDHESREQRSNPYYRKK